MEEMAIEIKNTSVEHLLDLKKDNTGLSFEKLYQELQKSDCSSSLKTGVYRFVCERLKSIEDEKGKFSLAQVNEFQEAIELVYSLTNAFTNKGNIAWAMATPIPSTIIAGTSNLYSLLESGLVRSAEQDLLSFYKEIEWPNSLLYALLLERLYGIPVKSRPYIFEYVNNYGVKKYVELEVDFSMVSVHAKADLPAIDFSCIRHRDMLTHRDIKPLLDSIHLDNFDFEGFSLLYIKDCTEKYVMQSIQLIIGNLSRFNRRKLYAELSEKVTSILDHPDIYSSLFPILSLNGVPILKHEVSKDNLLFRDYQQENSESKADYLHKFLKSPFLLSYGVHPEFDTTIPEILKSIKKAGVRSYICCPLKYHDKLVGLVELYTREGELLSPVILTRLTPFFPILTQLAYDLGVEFKNRLDAVILENFTALQPSVQWRFNQSAALYLKEKDDNIDAEVSVEPIIFKDVYPMYGMVDVKDSTSLRNLAFRKDNKMRLIKLKNLMSFIPQGRYPDSAAFQSFMSQLREVEHWLFTNHMVENMLEITRFFQVDVPTFVLTLPWLDSKLDNELKTYSEDIAKDPYQESYEQSLQMVNSTIRKELEKLNNFVQGNFPSYFETFRTDGLDYDIYVGQSISPFIPFDPVYIRLFRRQQIVSMAQIWRTIEVLKHKLPVPMDTTQLIFVHSSTIDLTFRKDERRFDVEGSYNIRYHMIKKRIDKVLVKGTMQRLVQPGKIAIVLNGTKDLPDLLEDLHNLAALGLLYKEIEKLELEDLQGVSGLIALRVEVCVDSSSKN